MRFLLVLAAIASVPGCLRVRVDPIQIEPIYIEVTVNHRIQRDLDSFFGELDRVSEAIDYKPLDELIEEN